MQARLRFRLQEQTEEVPAAEIDPVFNVNIAGLDATSYFADSKDLYLYHMQSAFDNNPLTSWVEGVDGPGIDQSLEIYFDREITVDTIKIMPGYFNEKWYDDNNRVKIISIFLDDFNITVELTDGMNVKEIGLGDEIHFKNAEFIIKDVYEGLEYDDTCITEIEFYLKGNKIILNSDEEIKSAYSQDDCGPSGKYFSREEMGSINYYFFPNGTYAYFAMNALSSLPFGIPRRIGTWQYYDSTGIIEMKAETRCYIFETGSYFQDIDTQDGVNYYEDYDFVLSDSYDNQTLDWAQCLTDSEEADFMYHIGNIEDPDYKLLETEITSEIVEYINEKKRKYSEYYEMMMNGELSEYIIYSESVGK